MDHRPRRPASYVRSLIGTLGIAIAIAVSLTQPAAAQPDGDPDAGAAVYRESCAMCHGGDATGMMGMHPALTGAVDRLGRDGVEITIRDGRSTDPPMPSFGDRLSDDEIADVLAYVADLPDGPRNFGPGHQDGGGGMMDGMMGGGPGWMVVLVIILAAALAGVTGYLVGTSRSPRSGGSGGSATGDGR